MMRLPARIASVLLALFLLVTLSVSETRAQDATAEDPDAWKRNLTAKLSGTQASFSNWAEGGVNSLAVSAGLSGSASHTSHRLKKRFESRLAFGLVKQDTLDFRKAEDVIRLAASLQYVGEGFFQTFNPTFAAVARTQFAPGFNYDKDPLPGGTRTPPVKVSDFFAPATFTQTLGLTYEPNDWFRQRFGLAVKETVVTIRRLQPLYQDGKFDRVRVEAGAELFTDFEREVFENVSVKSSLGLFAAFNNPDSPDLIWENFVTMKVNSWLTTNLEFVTLFDSDVSKQVQVKEVFSVGIQFTIL